MFSDIFGTVDPLFSRGGRCDEVGCWQRLFVCLFASLLVCLFACLCVYFWVDEPINALLSHACPGSFTAQPQQEQCAGCSAQNAHVEPPPGLRRSVRDDSSGPAASGDRSGVHHSHSGGRSCRPSCASIIALNVCSLEESGPEGSEAWHQAETAETGMCCDVLCSLRAWDVR